MDSYNQPVFFILWTATINQSSSSYGLLKLSQTTSNILACYIFLVVQRCTGCNVHCIVLAPDNVAAVCTEDVMTAAVCVHWRCTEDVMMAAVCVHWRCTEDVMTATVCVHWRCTEDVMTAAVCAGCALGGRFTD